VRQVFHWYVYGSDKNGPMSIYAISCKLNEMGVPTFADTGTRKPICPKQRGYGQWARSPINRMLRNETYAGVWRYGKTTRKDGQWIQNSDDHLLAVKVPALISRDLWKAAQVRLAENRSNGRCNRKHDYLLSGRVTCGTCGLKMAGSSKFSQGKVYLYYRCPATVPNSNTARTCHAPSFRAGDVDAVTWEWIRSNIINPDELLRDCAHTRKSASMRMNRSESACGW